MDKNIIVNLKTLYSSKNDIINSINNKGGNVAADTHWSDLAAEIDKIETGGGGSEVVLPEILDTDPLTFVKVDKGEGFISIDYVGYSASATKNMSYKKNDDDWVDYPVNLSPKIVMNYGDKIQFKSNSTSAMAASSTQYRYFNTNGIYKCGGTLASLRNGNVSTALSSNHFNHLFYYCNIISAPVLPFMSLAQNCYTSMFYGCTCLQKAPELPATTLQANCYSYMFNACTLLQESPKLPATTIVSTSYSNMFNGCRNLKKVYCNATTVGTSTITNSISANFLNGVPDDSSCVFYKNSNWDGPSARGVNTIPSNWVIEDWEK